jgi:polysaccharide biosynthesis/export protein
MMFGSAFGSKRIVEAFFLVTVLLSLAGKPCPALAADPSAEEFPKKTSSGPVFPASLSPQAPQPALPVPRVDAVAAPLEKPKAISEDRTQPVVPSPLERMITSDETLEAGKVNGANPAKSLTQFGYSYFKNVSFSPQTEVSVSDDYLTGPGDSLVLNLWGSVEGSYDLTVSRSGEVLLPKVGPVKVAGIPFGKLAEVFRLRLNRDFRDYHLSVSMGKLRNIKVFVVGEVNSPGDYSVSSLSTLINALGAAGGPTKNGSLRNIMLRHAGHGDETIDLYSFFTRGDKSRDVRLSSGDTIFVPVLGRVAAIAGSVKRPAIYELKDERTLKDLIGLAEGLTATGYLPQVQISRVVANEKKKVIDLNLESAGTGKTQDELLAAVAIQDLDVVRIFSINSLLRDHFRLEGHLDRPGSYALKPGLRLSDVLALDHFLPEYYPSFIEVTRLMPPDLQPQKIVVKLDGLLSRDPAQDLEIKEFDVIRVFSKLELERQPKVKVAGEVQTPGEYRLFKEMRLRDLLIQGGYPTPSAYLASAEISRLKRTNDKVTSYPLSVNLADALKGDPTSNILLEPFDELTVRKIPNWADETERHITLSGEFRFPGVYPIYKGEHLSSVIERAGGYSDKAYLAGAKFTRESLRQLQQKRMDEALTKTEAEVAKKQADLASTAASKEEADATKAALEGLQRSINLLKNKRAEGRLVIRVAALEEMKNTRADLAVEGGDNLTVPTDPDAVNILGQVYNPTSVAYEPHSNAGYYINKVGGPSKDADEDEIYLVKMDGTVFSKQQSTFFHRFMSRDIDSGDTIVVPQQFEKTAWLRDIKDIATILGQIALTAGVLIATGL